MSSPNTFSHRWVPSGIPVLDGIPGPWHHSLALRGQPGLRWLEHCLSDARKKSVASQSPLGCTGKHSHMAERNSNNSKNSHRTTRGQTESLRTSGTRNGRGNQMKERWKPFPPLSATGFKIKFKLINQTPGKSLWLQETLLEPPRPSPASPSPEQRLASAGTHGPTPEPCRNTL